MGLVIMVSNGLLVSMGVRKKVIVREKEREKIENWHSKLYTFFFYHVRLARHIFEAAEFQTNFCGSSKEEKD